MNKPLSAFAKKLETFKTSIVEELKEKVAKIEEKESFREFQTLESLDSLAKNIVNFEAKMEAFAN